MMGILGLFSVGFYVLPALFPERAGLSQVNYEDLTVVVFMALVFFFAIILGVLYGEFRFINKSTKSYNTPFLDFIFFNNYKTLFYLNFLLWLAYYFTNDLSSYNAEDLDAYYNNRSVYAGILGSLANIFLAILSVSLAIAIKKKSKNRILMIPCFVIVILLLMVTAQRLNVITPIFMFVAALAIYNNFKLGIRVIGFGILFLVIISPIMVFLRELNDVNSKEDMFEASSEYTSENAIESSFNSILERADLYYVMIHLKKHFDSPLTNFDHYQYYSSILGSFLPRIIVGEKSQVLSDNGKLSGETSVLAWNIIIGKDIGSLSAFGAITAYREGGWLWVIVNGFLTGLMYVWVFSFFCKGGHLGKVLFISIFVSLCVKQVPPSFFYLIVFIKPTIIMAMVLFLINSNFKKKFTVNTKSII